MVTLRRGQWVYSQGDEGTGLCAVIEGALRLEVALGTERDVLIGLAPAPAILGQARRVGGGPRILTVRANTASRVLMIPDDALDRAAAHEPAVWRAINELVYAQLEQMTRLAAHLLIQTPRGRVAMRLLQFAEGDGAPVSQADLAEMTGLSRKTVNAHLAALEQTGVITRGYRAITLVDRAALERIARG
ncbi:cAMP receptor protein [Sphingomonas mucosissima]|uniref:cAMP receptor protein n=2 Tax=Sphingomonas mucosissima TaxID=370959 RepID=A0A245ZIR4_9SPHN|nr:cAMP receptor protein [Sphingomonas mucosissima]